VSKVTSIRIDDDLASRLEELAVALDRPKSWLIEQAIASYVEEQAWQVRAISDALDAYNDGLESLTPHEEVMDRVEAKIRSRR